MGVSVGVEVGVLVAVFVGVGDGVTVGVEVGVKVGVGVKVEVGVGVRVSLSIWLCAIDMGLLLVKAKVKEGEPNQTAKLIKIKIIAIIQGVKAGRVSTISPAEIASTGIFL